ncbi:MAG: fumarate hydratase [Elusimicrobia bacterium]|nr:fumarate hydratase [Elusimicrobiota bacterium]
MTATTAGEFVYRKTFQLGKDETRYRSLGKDCVRVEKFRDREMLVVEPEALAALAHQAFRDVGFLLRTKHLEQLAAILNDPHASRNDKAVALELLQNAEISARYELPNCQDTGTATIVGKKGQQVWTGEEDEAWLSKGVLKAYAEENFRYSQVVPGDMYEEKNSGSNLPAQIDLYATEGMAYEFLFIAKGGGSANKTVLFQETKAVLTPQNLKKFLVEKMKTLGTAACPPYHVAFVVGGTSAEATLKAVKLASAGYLDHLPASGDEQGRAFRDLKLEAELLDAARKSGFGAQFGGRHFAHDVRVIRLSRHAASCPIGMGVSCTADRNIKGRIDKGGVWLEQMEREPGRLIPEQYRKGFGDDKAARIDLNRPMKEIRAELSKRPVSTQLLLTGRIIVARDIAHAKLKERLDSGKGIPDYFKNHPVYYAGPAKKPKDKAAGSFGPTTSGRMDAYVDLFQSQGASMVMIGKGNRTLQVTEACKKHGGFYLGSTGGAAALLAEKCIRKVEVVDYPDLGMESVWGIDVADFPAYVLIDDKGNDFYKKLSG